MSEKDFSDRQDQAHSKMGSRMMYMAWIIGIGLATYIFGSIEEKQNNPNARPASSRSGDSTKVVLKRNKYGHYVTSGFIDNKSVVFLLDTGATDVAIPGSMEKELGLKRGQAMRMNTANGFATAYATKIESVQIGDIVLYNVRASISPTMQGDEVLLGMAALKQLELRQKGDSLTLIQGY